MSADGESSPPASRLVAVELDPGSIGRSSPDIEHERATAIYDLLDGNRFEPAGLPPGAFRLRLAINDGKLVFDIGRENDQGGVTHILSLTPFRRLVQDYFLVCDSYYAAIRTATPSRIEAIDMGRRALHDEGSALLRDRLAGKIELDFETARRLFTLICALYRKG